MECKSGLSVCFGLFIGFMDTEKQPQPHPPVSLTLYVWLSLSPTGSPSPSPPPPPSPPSKGRLLHLFVPAGHIFSPSFVFFFSSLVSQSVCSEASYSPDHIRQARRRLGHSEVWEAGRREGISGGISAAVGGGLRSEPGVRLPVCEDQQRTGG